MRRKSVVKRLKSVARLRSIIHACRDDLDRRLISRPEASRDGALSYRPLLDHLLAEIIAVERRLTETENGYDLDQLRVSGYRQERKKAALALHSHQDWTRRFLLAYTPCRGSAELALEGPTPQGGPALVMKTRRTLAFLRALERVAPNPDAAVKIDPTNLVGKLGTALDKLEAANTELDEACSAADASRYQANEAITEYDRVAPWVARGLESLCRLAGECELADRIQSIARG